MAAVAMAGAGATAAAKVASEEAIKIRRSRSARNWAGLDSNQRRRKASRFTVCPVWPLRYLPVAASTERILSATGRTRCGEPAQADANCRSLLKKINDRVYHKLLRFARNFRIHRQ